MARPISRGPVLTVPRDPSHTIVIAPHNPACTIVLASPVVLATPARRCGR